MTLLKEVAILRKLYQMIEQMQEKATFRVRKETSLKQRLSRSIVYLKLNSNDVLDLLSLSCKFAMLDSNESQADLSDVKSTSFRHIQQRPFH